MDYDCPNRAETSNCKDGVYQAFNQIKICRRRYVSEQYLSTLQLFVVSNEQTTRYFANALPKDLHPKFYLVGERKTMKSRKLI